MWLLQRLWWMLYGFFFFLYLDRWMEYVDDKQEEMLSGFGPFYPYWIPVIVFSLWTGVLMGIPLLLQRVGQPGVWKWNGENFVLVIPALFFTVSPLLLYSPLWSGKVMKVFPFLARVDVSFFILCGVVSGYFLTEGWEKRESGKTK
jgi:hypothetical protein